MPWTKFLFSFEGRINRRTYWLRFGVPLFLIVLAAAIAAPPPAFGEVMSVMVLLTLWPAVAVGAKRCHDRNRPAWFLLICLLPLIGNIWLLIELGFLRGTAGPNRFGPRPIEAA